jgi:hypothetical protein
MTSRTTQLVVALTVVAAASACTNAADGTPRPAPDGGGPSTSASESSNSVPTTSPDDNVPQVDSPLDASSFVAAPCTSLTDEQRTAFNVGAGKPHGGGNLPPGCGWFGDDGAVGVGWLEQNENGLADTYLRRDEDAYFVETEVDGYPGVFTDLTDGRPSGRCGVVVAVSDTMTFYASVNAGPVGDAACDKAKQVAAAILDTVRAGS